jgi:adhesin transport system outer membrane protein
MSLTELIQGLLENDSSIKSSESAVKEAKNDVQTAWNAYLPELDLKLIRGHEIKYKYEAANDAYDHQEMDVTLKQKLYDFGETGSDIKQKRNAYTVAQLDLQAERMTIIIDAVDAYLGYVDAVKKLDSETEALESKIESTGQEESRVKKGSGMASDVLQAKSDLAGAQKTKIQAEGDLRKAHNKFFKVFKIDPPDTIENMQLIELSVNGKLQLPKDVDAATEVALASNIDLQTKKYDLMDAEQDLVASRAEFAPDLDFESTYKWKYNVSGTKGGTEEVNWKVTLAVPLQPWQDFPDYKNKKYALLTAEDDLDEETYATKQSIGDLWEDYQVAILTKDFALNKIIISEELLAIKKKERLLDQADAAAVTAAENSVNDDTKALIDDETSLTEASLDLLEAMGVLTIDSIQDVAAEEATVETSATETAATEEQVTEEQVTEEQVTEEQVTEEQATEEQEVASLEAVPVEPVTEGDLDILSELKDLIQERANESDTGEVSDSGGCASNVYVGQQQEDGSWKTVCKNTDAALEADSVEPVIVETSTDTEILQQLEQLLMQPEVPSSEGCESNVYVGQQQEDGSWKTVCKK